jgi:hypothetical protein
VVDQPATEPAPRHVAAGGWRRAVVGLLVGALAGVVVGLLLPSPNRTVRRGPSDAPGTSPRR